jgi:hypothetical protein
MNNITSAPNIINCGNPSSENLKIRNRMKDKKETPSDIFAKLNKRGKLDPRQNAMNYQLTNNQLFRYYCQDVEPKLEQSNETTGENPNDILKKEIQRLINVGDTKNEDLIKVLQSNLGTLTQAVNTAGTAPVAPLAPLAPVATPPVGGSSWLTALLAPPPLAPLGGGVPPLGGGVPPPPASSGGGGPPPPPASSAPAPAASAPAPASSAPAPASVVAAITSAALGGTSGIAAPSTPPPIGGSIAFTSSVTSPSITSTAALASTAAAASTAGSGLLVVTPSTAAAAATLASMGTSTNTNLFLPIKDGTSQDYSLPVTTYVKINSAGIWTTKKNEWPSLGDNVHSRQAWDRIIPNLDNSDFQLRLDKMNEFVALYPKPREFLEAYKAANPTFGTGSVSSASPSPAAGGSIASISTIPPSPITAPTSPSAAATGVALFPPTKAQRWASKAKATGADAAAYTAATGVNTVLFSEGTFGSSSRFGS